MASRSIPFTIRTYGWMIPYVLLLVHDHWREARPLGVDISGLEQTTRVLSSFRPRIGPIRRKQFPDLGYVVPWPHNQ